MKIILIAAIDLNGGIGKDNKLLCHLPADLKHFKQLTQGKTVIMGRKTFESLPSGALPNRRNIVISRQTNLTLANCEVFNSLTDAFASCESESEVFVIGGENVYKQAIANAHVLEITQIDARFDADAFFPVIDLEKWKRVQEEAHSADERHPYAYTFITYTQSK
ncbi:MAG: dihydrofolate reductase [Paludibacteraceae bacterium]|nr:dihydrofolate reductase [Paludibacteraceae bacterium]